MSFDQLSALERGQSAAADYSDDPAFDRLASSLSSRLFTLTASIAHLNRQLSLINTKKDSEALRADIRARNESTREECKQISSGVKKLQYWADVGPARSYARDKLSKQFTSLLKDFQTAQRDAAEKLRKSVGSAVGEPQLYDDDAEDTDTGSTLQLQQMQLSWDPEDIALADQGEVDFQALVIQERDAELMDIEQGMTEMNDIFRDLATIVWEQDVGLLNIESNVLKTAVHHRAAHGELMRAARWQKGTRRRACCFFVVLAVVGVAVVVAVVS